MSALTTTERARLDTALAAAAPIEAAPDLPAIALCQAWMRLDLAAQRQFLNDVIRRDPRLAAEIFTAEREGL